MNEYVIPPLELAITTYEQLPDGRFQATVTHIFHADTEEEAYGILQSHTITDSFFKASLCGLDICEFPWKDGKIILKSSQPEVITGIGQHK